MAQDPGVDTEPRLGQSEATSAGTARLKLGHSLPESGADAEGREAERRAES